MSPRNRVIDPSRTGMRRRRQLAALALAQLLVAADSTIVTVALPTAGRDLGMSDAAAQWIVSAYTVFFGGALLLGGQLADRLGSRPVLLFALSGFTGASFLGGAAIDSQMIIGARCAQGLLAAMIVPATIWAVVNDFDNIEERRNALRVMSGVTMSGAVFGLCFGGLIAGTIGWRWCLYANVPICVVLSAYCWFSAPRTPVARERKVDWISSLLCTGGVAALVYGMSFALTASLRSRPAVLSLISGTIFVIAFIIRQSVVKNALLPLSIVVHRDRGSVYFAATLTSFATFGTWMLLTYYFQTFRDYGPLQAALALLPLVLAVLAGIQLLSGRLMRRRSLFSAITVRLIFSLIGMLLVGFLSPNSSYWILLVPAQVLVGLGGGIAQPILLNAVVSSLAPTRGGVASAFFVTAQQVGVSIGAATLTTIAIGTEPPGTVASNDGYAMAATAGVSVLAAGMLLIFLMQSRRGRERPNPDVSRG